MRSGVESIRHAMQVHGLNQKETAACLEISEQYLSDILRKRRGISAFVAVRLEDAFGIDAHRLMLDQALIELFKARSEFKAGKTEPVAEQVPA